MNDRRQADSGTIPKEWLEARLRALKGVEPPGRLKDKLLSGVPASGADHGGFPPASHRFRVLRYVGVAAAILILASLAVPRLTFRSGPPRIIADINDRSGSSALVDHNHPRPADINVYDHNAVP